MVAVVREVEATESTVTTECLNRGSDYFHILGVAQIEKIADSL